MLDLGGNRCVYLSEDISKENIEEIIFANGDKLTKDHIGGYDYKNSKGEALTDKAVNLDITNDKISLSYGNTDMITEVEYKRDAREVIRCDISENSETKTKTIYNSNGEREREDVLKYSKTVLTEKETFCLKKMYV